jgi:superfamily I DNA/RNA helicase
MILNRYDNYPDIWKYKSVILDEGQDFDQIHIELIKAIVE